MTPKTVTDGVVTVSQDKNGVHSMSSTGGDGIPSFSWDGLSRQDINAIARATADAIYQTRPFLSAIFYLEQDMDKVYAELMRRTATGEQPDPEGQGWARGLGKALELIKCITPEQVRQEAYDRYTKNQIKK